MDESKIEVKIFNYNFRKKQHQNMYQDITCLTKEELEELLNQIPEEKTELPYPVIVLIGNLSLVKVKENQFQNRSFPLRKSKKSLSGNDVLLKIEPLFKLSKKVQSVKEIYGLVYGLIIWGLLPLYNIIVLIPLLLNFIDHPTEIFLYITLMVISGCVLAYFIILGFTQGKRLIRDSIFEYTLPFIDQIGVIDVGGILLIFSQFFYSILLGGAIYANPLYQMFYWLLLIMFSIATVALLRRIYIESTNKELLEQFLLKILYNSTGQEEKDF